MSSMRTFDTGATKSSDKDKLDYEGFLSPLALQMYAEYMHKHRLQADGSLRESDNWQKGIPIRELMKSLLRHVLTAWRAYRGWPTDEVLKDALCASMFNVQAILHFTEEERIKRERETIANESVNHLVKYGPGEMIFYNKGDL